MRYGNVAETTDGRCGACRSSGFEYANGHEFSASGVRGYRCKSCGAIKREDWRKRLAQLGAKKA